MKKFDANKAQCVIFTFKEGLLSTVAHDLKLEVTRFVMELDDDGTVVASFEADSFEVLGAMKGGELSSTMLKAKDIKEIKKNMAKSVLKSKTYPKINFRGRIDEVAKNISGSLTICGQTRRISFVYKEVSGTYKAEIQLHQPDWSIKPFSALLGTLKVKDDIIIQISVPM